MALKRPGWNAGEVVVRSWERAYDGRTHGKEMQKWRPRWERLSDARPGSRVVVHL